jgi:signal transduction histidine kinase
MYAEQNDEEDYNLMEDLSLHILDIVENSIRANSKNVKIEIIEDKVNDLLTLIVDDNGRGMDEETRRRAVDPFFTTKDRKETGLGLSFFAQSAEEAGGELRIESEPEKGTRVTATFKLNNIDRKPLGNIEETIRCLRATHPEINFVFNFKRIE